MALVLYFNPAKFPRSITHKEWQEIWRWKRVVEKRLDKELLGRLSNFAVYGTTHPEIYDEIINPPLLIHDKQELG